MPPTTRSKGTSAGAQRPRAESKEAQPSTKTTPKKLPAGRRGYVAVVELGNRSSIRLDRRRDVFKYVTNLDEHDVIGDLTLGRPVKTPATTSTIAAGIADLLGTTKKEAATLLGISESTMSRQTPVRTDALDRALTMSAVYADVAAVLGADGATAWFSTPNPAFDGERPVTLMSTRTGQRKVEGVVAALLDGAYL
ncbi:antitoxin Xre/MbcA/ParS toxin-binding domain-containing protein [Deinococcus yavapaiensis]|uniref:Uncharacterized protein DUF2384 n=1 Tax=Deinococcus yavapaiensis KR-236 TaxID=694435 RepID=A0A318SF82_9DEIO|nr:antitoxin Xre/MbcA/ParS toxin-binding domain-containing protein [Deinococcus yavapaiensis]PYE52039.1 uncharacterized protein DUF2384 [Deinococcus yavapaiensis KR-236]